MVHTGFILAHVNQASVFNLRGKCRELFKRLNLVHVTGDLVLFGICQVLCNGSSSKAILHLMPWYTD